MGRDVNPPNEAANLRDLARRVAILEQQLRRGAAQPVGRTMDLPFTFPGVLTVTVSPYWRPPWSVRLTTLFGTLLSPPSSTTTVQLRINAVGYESLIFAAGNTLAPLVTLDHTIGPGDVVQMAVTVVGGSPAGLDAQLGGTIVNG